MSGAKIHLWTVEKGVSTLRIEILTLGATHNPSGLRTPFSPNSRAAHGRGPEGQASERSPPIAVVMIGPWADRHLLPVATVALFRGARGCCGRPKTPIPRVATRVAGATAAEHLPPQALAALFALALPFGCAFFVGAEQHLALLIDAARQLCGSLP